MVIGVLTLGYSAAAQVPTAQNVRALDRGTEYYNSTAAADAATEKVFQSMSADFLQGGENLVSNRISYYESLYPNAADDPYWTNYSFGSPVSGPAGAWVGLVGTNEPGLPGMVPGSYVYNWVYRIAANAQSNNSPTGLTAAVWQDVALGYLSTPVFGYAIFYNGTMEFSDCAPTTVNGPIHCNTNINVGTISGSSLTFNTFVSASGIITNPPAAGYPKSSWTGPIAYNGTPSPGYGTGEPVIILPLGTNSLDPNSAREIINPPPVGESTTNPISAQRYYNKADLVIIITNAYVPSGSNLVLVTNATSAATTNAVFVYVKNSMYDPGPLFYAVTNGITNGTNNGINYTAEWFNWASAGFTNWLSFNNTFTDQRESRTTHVAQIDLFRLGTWIGNRSNGCTNVYLTAKWNNATPFNGIIYVQDLRTTNSSWMNCVRLTDGQNITNGLYQTGLTVATQNPLYIQGLYNCPSSTNVLSTNTIGCRPCSVICDALTILSPAWIDANSTPALAINAADDTVDTAIIAGNVTTTDTTATGYSGGVQNLPRLLEDWSGANLYLNTSMVCLYTSAQAVKQWEEPGVYYYAPSRHIFFDENFLNPTSLPPGTPSQMFIERLDRLTPGPTANPSP